MKFIQSRTNDESGMFICMEVELDGVVHKETASLSRNALSVPGEPYVAIRVVMERLIERIRKGGSNE